MCAQVGVFLGPQLLDLLTRKKEEARSTRWERGCSRTQSKKLVLIQPSQDALFKECDCSQMWRGEGSPALLTRKAKNEMTWSTYELQGSPWYLGGLRGGMFYHKLL